METSLYYRMWAATGCNRLLAGRTAGKRVRSLKAAPHSLPRRKRRYAPNRLYCHTRFSDGCVTPVRNCRRVVGICVYRNQCRPPIGLRMVVKRGNRFPFWWSGFAAPPGLPAAQCCTPSCPPRPSRRRSLPSRIWRGFTWSTQHSTSSMVSSPRNLSRNSKAGLPSGPTAESHGCRENLRLLRGGISAGSPLARWPLRCGACWGEKIMSRTSR